MTHFTKSQSMNDSKQRGFTLIEVMISMVVLGIGLLAIAGLQSREMMYNNSSKRQTQAYTWAMEAAEHLMSEPYKQDFLSVGTHTLDPGVPEELEVINEMDPYVLTWDVVDNDANLLNTILVNVYVSWAGNEIARIDFTRTRESI